MILPVNGELGISSATYSRLFTSALFLQEQTEINFPHYLIYIYIYIHTKKMHKLPYFPLLLYTQEQNKDEIMQCLIIHDTILKHKAIVNQLRKGLSILGFLNEL